MKRLINNEELNSILEELDRRDGRDYRFATYVVYRYLQCQVEQEGLRDSREGLKYNRFVEFYRERVGPEFVRDVEPRLWVEE